MRPRCLVSIGIDRYPVTPPLRLRLLFCLSGNKQHTFIETDTVRYVYQPIENLFLLLVTNKASNIVQDLETLRMLSKGRSICLLVILFLSNFVKPFPCSVTTALYTVHLADSCLKYTVFFVI